MAKSKNAPSRRSVLDYINTQAVKSSSTDEHRKGPKSQTSGIQALSVMPAHHETISADAEERYTGKCLCGQISYEVLGKPVYCALCHCVNCKRWTGSGSMWFAVFSEQVCTASSVSSTRSSILPRTCVTPKAKTCSRLTQTAKRTVEELPFAIPAANVAAR